MWESPHVAEHYSLCDSTSIFIIKFTIYSHGAVRSVASPYAAMCMVAGSRPVLVIAWEWHIGLTLLCGCSGALEYPATNSCGPINKSLSLLHVLEHLFHIQWVFLFTIPVFYTYLSWRVIALLSSCSQFVFVKMFVTSTAFLRAFVRRVSISCSSSHHQAFLECLKISNCKL